MCKIVGGILGLNMRVLWPAHVKIVKLTFIPTAPVLPGGPTMPASPLGPDSPRCLFTNKQDLVTNKKTRLVKPV